MPHLASNFKIAELFFIAPMLSYFVVVFVTYVKEVNSLPGELYLY